VRVAIPQTKMSAKVNEMLYGAPAEHYERLVALLE
jgi:hypothetical protein